MRINRYTVKLVKEEGINYKLEDDVISPYTAWKVIERVFELSSSPVEKLGIIALNTQNKIAGLHIIVVGGLNKAFVELRSIFQPALLNNAASIILFHNHPSGSTKPSKEDISLTGKLYEAGRLLGIQILDHIIVGEEGYISLKDAGLF